MKKLIVIADVHGKVNEYKHILDSNLDIDMSIQLGDFGFKKQNLWFIENIYTSENKHRILFGNHDYYPYLDLPYSLKHEENLVNEVFLDKGIFCVRGADSIDKHMRLEGRDWFNNEQLSYKEFSKIIEDYEEIKPSIVISHDAPQQIREEVFNIPKSSLTSTALQQMFEIHKPALWIHGHHHHKRYTYIDGCEIISLGELDFIEI